MAETKWPPFRRRHFRTHLLELKCLCFNSNCTEICSKRSNYQYDGIGSDNGLAANRHCWLSWVTHICVSRSQIVNRNWCVSGGSIYYIKIISTCYVSGYQQLFSKMHCIISTAWVHIDQHSMLLNDIYAVFCCIVSVYILSGFVYPSMGT